MCCTMPVFISGFLFFRNFDNHKWNTKISKRLKTLVIPYFLWNCITCILWYIVYTVLGKDYLTDENIPLNTVDAIINIFKYSPLWYLYDLFLYGLLSPIIYILLRKKTLAIFVLLLSSTLIILNSFTYFSPLYWLPVFMLGGFFGTYNKDYFSNEASFLTTPTLFLWITVFIIQVFFQHYTLITILRITAPFFVVACYNTFERCIHIKTHHIYKYSFFLYASHYVFLCVGQHMCISYLGQDRYAILIAATVVPFLVIILCITLAYMLENKLSNIYSILSGNR